MLFLYDCLIDTKNFRKCDERSVCIALGYESVELFLCVDELFIDAAIYFLLYLEC